MLNSLLMLTSLVLYAASVWSVKNSGTPAAARYGYSLCGFFLVLMTGFFLICDSFTTSGIDDSIVYHLRYGLAGAGFQEYKGALTATGMFFLLSGLTFAVSLRLLKPCLKKPARLGAWGAQLILGMAFLAHPAVHDFFKLYAPRFAHQSTPAQFATLYQMPKFDNAPAQAKNLVYIYAESLERTYFDENLFPGLITGLKELEQRALSFTGLEQVSGTHWTIAGKVASQCGIPLVTASGGNSMSGIDRFLPGATCLGDVLHARGYNLIYMGGADNDFAGKSKFYDTHGFSEVLGKNELQGHLKDKDYINAWGLYDDFLLERAYQRFEELAQAEEPFGLFALTLDTHHPKGHLSQRCDDMLYKDGDNPILNAVRCSDFLITDFVQKILHSPHAQDTIVVIGSDHLAMGNTATKQLTQGERRNLFLVLDPSKKEPAFIDKKGTTLDIAATLLTLLGYEAPAFGLGRSLLGNEPTLAVQEANLLQTLAGLNPDIAKFWEHPEIQVGIRINVQEKQLQIADRTFRLPTLLRVGADGEIQDVFFEYHLFDYSEKLASFVLNMNPDDAIVWIDACSNFQQMEATVKETLFCVFAGKISDKNAFTAQIHDELFISRDQLIQFLAGAVGPMVVDQRKNSLNSAQASQL